MTTSSLYPTRTIICKVRQSSSEFQTQIQPQRPGRFSNASQRRAPIGRWVNTKIQIIKEIEFYSEKVQNQGSDKERRTILKASTSQEKQLLQTLSATKELPFGLSTFKDHADVFTPKPWFNNLHCFTDEQVSQVEEETKDQAACKAWHQHRAGRITGSSANRVIHTSLEEPSQALIKVDQLTTNSKHHAFYGARTMRWMYKYALGLSTALSQTSTKILVSDQVYKKHINLKVEKAGFRILKTLAFLVMDTYHVSAVAKE
ncbi:hypothetical protein J4Q44_G00054350 [Coregonus suidteri]|uniref:Uncharacterized protein n=1 Tax=Coregonus suidteri TaxID=861788 RepID=A0AAN8MCC9_9TELE